VQLVGAGAVWNRAPSVATMALPQVGDVSVRWCGGEVQCTLSILHLRLLLLYFIATRISSQGIASLSKSVG
jgi:hypothetical protein